MKSEQEFLIEHRPLAIWAARRAKAFSDYYRSIPMSDLIQEALFGILLAYRTYDPSQGATLSSWCAKRAVWQISNTYGKTYHRDPVVGALPLWSEDLIDKWYWFAEYEEESERQTVSAKLADAMESIGVREKAIIRLLYGLETGDTYTLEQVGRIFRLTKARIAQIRDRGLDRLHNDECMVVWREYAEYEQAQKERRMWNAMLARRSRSADESPRIRIRLEKTEMSDKEVT
jgi:RNA polymerase sigma factor (sigma-70 family)